MNGLKYLNLSLNREGSKIIPVVHRLFDCKLVSRSVCLFVCLTDIHPVGQKCSQPYYNFYISVLAGPTRSTCTDSNKSCPAWANLGECTKNLLWMKHNCKLSCGLC